MSQAINGIVPLLYTDKKYNGITDKLSYEMNYLAGPSSRVPLGTPRYPFVWRKKG